MKKGICNFFVGLSRWAHRQESKEWMSKEVSEGICVLVNLIFLVLFIASIVLSVLTVMSVKA